MLHAVPGVGVFVRVRGNTTLSCRHCRHFLDEPLALEQELPGIGALSSALGSTRGDAGICQLLGTFQDPHKSCAEFEPRRSHN